MNIERLIEHVKLCRRNLKSDKVKCCAMCPFEEEIVRSFPDMELLFHDKRYRLENRRA